MKLGANIDDFALSDAASIFANNLNANGVDAVIGELSSTQLNNILPFISADLSNAGITLGTQSANTYNGTSGADKYLGLGGNDTLYGNNGNDELFGDAGADKLYGGNNDDLLVGGTGNDNLYGESGNDTLLGGKGTDNLYGGIGADLFVFDGADVGTGADRIKDFSLSQGDRIDISDVLDQYDPATDSLSQFVRLKTSGANTLLQVDVNGTESGGFTTIATIENVTGLDLNALVNNGTILV